MPRFGYFLSCEEFGPAELIRQAKLVDVFRAAGGAGKAVPCGNDVGRFTTAIGEFTKAGFDEIYLRQIGHDQDRFFDFWTSSLAPELDAA